MSEIEQFASLYSTAYYLILLLLCGVAVVTYSKNNIFLNKGIAWPLAVAIILFLAFRPLTYKFGFGDTQGYAYMFGLTKLQSEIDPNAKDMGYEYISFFLQHCDVSILFMVMGALYVVPQVLTSKKLSPAHYGIIFLTIVFSFSYWGYGVNGMRNGAALSLAMLGMVLRHRIWTSILFLTGYSIHGSALLPIAAFCLNFLYSKSKTYMIVWCVCVVLSIFISNLLTEIIPLNDLIDDGRTAYLAGDFDNYASDRFSSTGYRWDFVLYSLVPIILGYRKIASGEVCDKVYHFLFNTYCTCNAFWLFTIYIPYNNRFAYLSWFLYPILVAYPYVGGQRGLTISNVRSMKYVVGLSYLFTFIMWLK